MLYHIKESIVPSAFCDEVIKQGEEKDISRFISKYKTAKRQIEAQMYHG